METDRQKHIVDLLTEYDLRGTQFITAKNELLAKGFSEAEIVQGLYSAPFDGRDNRQTPPPSTLEKMYAEHPEKAEQVAHSLLLDVAEKDLHLTVAQVAASRFAPGMHAQTYYTSRALDRLGISYLALLISGAILLGVAMKLNIPNEIIDLCFRLAGYGIMLYAAFLLTRKWLRVRRLRGK